MNAFANASRLIALCAIAAASTAHAGEHIYRVDHAAYRQECGSCHVPFPPALLAPTSWQAVMDGLPKHFGTDASVDNATRADILAFLANNAGRRATATSGTPQLRISETAWFAKEHRREIAAGSPTRPAVKSIANCSGCHRNAEKGDYSKQGLDVPGGRAR